MLRYASHVIMSDIVHQPLGVETVSNLGAWHPCGEEKTKFIVKLKLLPQHVAVQFLANNSNCAMRVLCFPA